MKRLIALAFATTMMLTAAAASAQTSAAGNFSVGLGPVGNVYVVDSNPELDPGIGGYVYFDYRWSP